MWTSELSTLSSHKGPLLYQVSEAILAAARLSFFRALASCFSPLEAKIIAETALAARCAHAACPPSVRLCHQLSVVVRSRALRCARLLAAALAFRHSCASVLRLGVGFNRVLER